MTFSTLKRKTPMKRTRMSKAPKQSIGKAKKLAWMWFSRFIRLRDSKPIDPENGARVCRCVTCGHIAPMSGPGAIHAGHFIPLRHNAVLYDERNVHGQCHLCNLWRRGAWIEYERFMLDKYGPAVVQELKDLSREIRSMTAADHLAVAEVYRGKVAGLGGWPDA